jgi:hypothetical protein
MMIHISRPSYDAMLRAANKTSSIYSILMDSLIVRCPEEGRVSETVMVRCEQTEAEALLELATQSLP